MEIPPYPPDDGEDALIEKACQVHEKLKQELECARSALRQQEAELELAVASLAIAENTAANVKREATDLLFETLTRGAVPTVLREQMEQWLQTVLSPVDLSDFNNRLAEHKRVSMGSILPKGYR